MKPKILNLKHMISKLRGNTEQSDQTHIALKLITAENIIARLDSVTKDGYVVDFPMIINYSFDEELARTRIYLTALNPFSTQKSLFTLDKKHVIFESIVDDDVIEFYEKNVSMKFKSYDQDEEETDMDFLASLKVTANIKMN